jgi:pyridoxal phosphate enzyme (YggS family)
MSSIVAEYRRIQDRIAAAADRAGRDPRTVSLVAVSKFHPAEAIAELARAGHQDFGENYVQEAREKQEALQKYDIRWHFIGAPQTNKAKHIVGRFHLLHSLESSKLAAELDKRCSREDVRQPLLIQVNLGGEAQKAGVAPEDLRELARDVLARPRLDLQGLMCMPPLSGDAESNRALFARLREMARELEQELGVELPHLSMGMSHDFEVAVEEGATLIRIGTSIFGERPSKQG